MEVRLFWYKNSIVFPPLKNMDGEASIVDLRKTKHKSDESRLIYRDDRLGTFLHLKKEPIQEQKKDT